MPGDALYQDLQYKHTDLYSELGARAGSHQQTPSQPEISKDADEQGRKLRKWKIATIVMILISVAVILLAIVVYVTTYKRQDINNNELSMLTGKICVNGEKPCSYCAQNWIYFSGNCYFFSRDEMNWADSRTNCLRMQAQLAVIKNDAEETFVEETGHGPAWIGLSKNSAGQWMFEDGTTLTGRGFFKKSDEPNNRGGSENCTEVFPSNYGNQTGWNDLPCEEPRRRLCKQPAFQLRA